MYKYLDERSSLTPLPLLTARGTPLPLLIAAVEPDVALEAGPG